MAPEQADGKPTDARSDVFSFGAVLYEMITGRRAFAAATKMSTLAALLTKEPQPPSQIVPGLSPDLEKMIARCLRKSPDRRWQSMADLKVALDDLREESDSRGLAQAAVLEPARRWTKTASAAAALLGIGALVFGAWWATRPPPPVGPGPFPFLTRLTFDVGWTDYPAISVDGKMLAYASDRSGEGNLDIWIQQLVDGAPVRLTRHAADDVEPSFSADGNRIAFQSARLGGGIYVIPTLGGEERLLAPHGFSPRFSPDGNWIAYGVAEQGGGRIYVAPAAGGPATPVAADFYRAQAHVWSPDSRHLLFWAQRHRDAPAENNIDWYVAAIPGGTPVPVDARNALARERFRGRARAAVSRCLGGDEQPHSLSWSGRRLLEHVAGGACPRDVAPPWHAAAGDIRHHQRSRSVGKLRRAHGVHQPNDGSRYLEPADRHESRASNGNTQTRHGGCCR